MGCMRTPSPDPLHPGAWTDTSGARVRVLPPALFALPLALAAVLRRRASTGPAASGPRRDDRRRRSRGGALRTVVALLAVGSGGAVMAWAFLTMRARRTTVVPWARVETLVTGGPFAHVRNPIYGADLLVYLGVSLWLRSWLPILALPAVLAVLHRWVIAPEEEYLQARFGRAYAAYRRTTPRLLPRRS